MPPLKEKLIRKLKRNKHVDNPYALATWIWTRRGKRHKKKHKKA